jgi:membrane protease YdiL (CAAX protease family)
MKFSREHEIVQIAPEPAKPPHNPDSITWGPWASVLLVVGSFIAATLIAQFALSIYPLSQHWGSQQTQDWLDNSIVVQFFYTLIAYALIALPIVWFMRLKGVSLHTFGVKRFRFRDIRPALLAFPIYFVTYGILLGVLSNLIPELNVDQKQQIGFTNAQGAGLILTFISLAVIPPVVEEFVMRGFLYTSLRAKLRLPGAVIITSLLFAAGHLQFGSGAPLLWVAALDTFVLSLFLIYLRVKTGSLWASILLHSLKNSLAFLYLFVIHK